MKPAVAILATLALLAALPTVAAQDPNPSGLTLTAANAGIVPYKGSGSFTTTLSIGCLEFATNPTASPSVVVSNAPAWMTVAAVEPDLSAADCGPSGRAETEVSIPFNVSEAAPAVVQHTLLLKATLGTTSSTEVAGILSVAYDSEYSLTPSVSFPLTVTEKVTTFTVTGVQASNAPSMIMVDDFSADSGALVAGIGVTQFANEAGKPETKTFTVTFTAPNKDWEKATVTLKVYGHYNFDGMAGEPEDRATITWEFVNGGVVAPDGDDKGPKDSPAPVGVLTALGLLGFAALRRRK